MKLFIICALLFQAAALSAQDAPGPAPAKPAAAPQAKYSAEILRTMKHLSVLLERSAEVPQERIDALAPEIAAFDEKVKSALGKDLLSDISRREKEEEDKARATSAKKTLQQFRGALQVYYGEQGGVYPKKLTQLIPSVMQEVPELYLPGHGRTSKVTIIDSRKYDKDFSKAITDSGGWLYFSDPQSSNYGLLLLDCSHNDAGGPEFFRY